MNQGFGVTSTQLNTLMPLFLPRKCKYSYTHLELNSASQAVDVHEIYITRSWVWLILSYVGIFFCLTICYILLVKEEVRSGSIWWIFVVLLFTKFVQYKPVKKESVMILPAFGVQLETHYWSGRIIHRFIPHGKILRPVLYECATPFICYWNLALILQGEDQLMLAFQELKPPLNFLVPIWKALCSALDCKQGREHFLKF